jgi:pimeloyl-ACP methyl ester carboxylesterase
VSLPAVPAPVIAFVDVHVDGGIGADRVRLRTATWGASTPSIVMLHDGLGSIGQWRSLPADVHQRTGATVMAYERAGHGQSTPVPDGAWPADWLHREAVVFASLLARLDIVAPLVVGHSDGGSVALIHAATGGAQRALMVFAAHTWVESVCTDAISVMRDRPDGIIFGLERHHDAPAQMFAAWSGAWLSDDFAAWDIRPLIGAIDCPTLVAQGTADEYATDAQLVETAAAIGDNAALRRLDGVGHIVHHAAPSATADLVAEFYDQHLAARGAAEEN